MSTDLVENDGSAQSGQSNEERQRSAQKAWRVTGIIVSLIYAVTLIGLMTFALKSHHLTRSALIVESGPRKKSFGALDNVKAVFTRDETPSAELPSDAALAAIDAEFNGIAFQLEVTQTKQAIQHLKTAEGAWTELLERTLHDDVGQRIAGNESELVRFTSLDNMPEPVQLTSDLPTDLREIERQAEESNDPSTLEQLSNAASTIKQQAFVVFAFHQARLHALTELRHEARNLPLSNFPLSTALNEREAHLITKRQAEAAAAAERLTVEMHGELEELETQRTTNQSLVTGLKNQLAQVERGEQTSPSAQPAPVLIQASRAEYRKELDDIRAKLKPFITPGYVQPESAENLVYETVKRPVSFSALQRVGALQQTEQGLEILFRIGGSKSATQHNDRPLGSFPRMNSLKELQKPEVTSRLREAQRLLRTYGFLMVEDDLLSR